MVPMLDHNPVAEREDAMRAEMVRMWRDMGWSIACHPIRTQHIRDTFAKSLR